MSLIRAGQASLEYVALAFNQENFLAAYSGVPDFKFDLWNWTNQELLCSVDSQLSVSAFSRLITTGS